MRLLLFDNQTNRIFCSTVVRLVCAIAFRPEYYTKHESETIKNYNRRIIAARLIHSRECLLAIKSVQRKKESKKKGKNQLQVEQEHRKTPREKWENKSADGNVKRTTKNGSDCKSLITCGQVEGKSGNHDEANSWSGWTRNMPLWVEIIHISKQQKKKCILCCPDYWTNELKLGYFFSNFLPKGNLINIKAASVAWSRSNVGYKMRW